MWSREDVISEWENGLRRELTWTHPLHHIIKMWLTMLTVCSENQDVVDKILEDYDISCIGKLNID